MTIYPEMQVNLTVANIAEVTSEALQVPLTDVLSESRKQELVFVRYIICHLSRMYLSSSRKELQQYFGYHDESSIKWCEWQSSNMILTGYTRYTDKLDLALYYLELYIELVRSEVPSHKISKSLKLFHDPR